MSEATTCYAQSTGGLWHIVPGTANEIGWEQTVSAVCALYFTPIAATDAIRETGDAPACPACLRYFYRSDDKR